MSIFKAKGYRDIDCLMSIAAIEPPPRFYRTMNDNKGEDDLIFHFTIVNNKDKDDERSAFIQLTKKDLRRLHTIIDGYLKTGITKEIP